MPSAPPSTPIAASSGRLTFATTSTRWPSVVIAGWYLVRCCSARISSIPAWALAAASEHRGGTGGGREEGRAGAHDRRDAERPGDDRGVGGGPAGGGAEAEHT